MGGSLFFCWMLSFLGGFFIKGNQKRGNPPFFGRGPFKKEQKTSHPSQTDKAQPLAHRFSFHPNAPRPKPRTQTPAGYSGVFMVILHASIPWSLLPPGLRRRLLQDAVKQKGYFEGCLFGSITFLGNSPLHGQDDSIRQESSKPNWQEAGSSGKPYGGWY